MSRPLRIAYPGAFYHITSRGNERKPVFKSGRDREKFLEYLESATSRYKAVIHVYCLMDNHYHLLLETPAGNLPRIMRHINGAYTTYFNVKRNRSGHLFQGRYKAILIDADEYAKELSRYIHLNPVRAGLVEKPEDYPWSSYRDYTGGRKPAGWLKRDFILEYFDAKEPAAQEKYKTFVNQLAKENYETPLKDLFASTILGCAEFITYLKEHHLKDTQPDRNVPATRRLSEMLSMPDIIEKVDQAVFDERLSRNIKLYLCREFTGERLKEIGDRFHVSESAVSHAARKMSELVAKDKTIRKGVEAIVKELKYSKFKT
jgi:putative transposase